MHIPRTLARAGGEIRIGVEASKLRTHWSHRRRCDHQPPEVIGGVRNWDYRYTWMRDAAFTVYGFLRIGFRKEAAGFVSWIQNYASKHFHVDVPCRRS